MVMGLFVGDVIAREGTSVHRWMDTVLCLPLSSRFNVCSLTRTLGKGPAVLGISLLYIVVAALSAPSATETVGGGLYICISCTGENAGLLLTFLS